MASSWNPAMPLSTKAARWSIGETHSLVMKVPGTPSFFSTMLTRRSRIPRTSCTTSGLMQGRRWNYALLQSSSRIEAEPQ